MTRLWIANSLFAILVFCNILNFCFIFGNIPLQVNKNCSLFVQEGKSTQGVSHGNLEKRKFGRMQLLIWNAYPMKVSVKKYAFSISALLNTPMGSQRNDDC